MIPRVAVGDKFSLMMPSAEPQLVAVLYANLCSFVLDYCARQKIGGVSLKFFTMRQLPVLAPMAYAVEAPWNIGVSVRDWLLPRVLELTYTAWDLESFARDVGYDGPPFRWDPVRRFLLRAELDAAFFHLYGISHDDADYILDTFPIVRRNDEKAHGEYRTRRVILEIYDTMAEATRTGQPYQTRLDPPAADPSVAHPPRSRASAVAPDLVALPDLAWYRPRTNLRGEAVVALAALLQEAGAGAPRQTIRLAAALVLEPRWLLPALAPPAVKQWLRVVGPEADPLPDDVSTLIHPVDGAWGAAIRQLRASGGLIEDLAARTWSPGSLPASLVTEGWPAGRAGFVLDILRQRGVESVLAALPEPIRRKINEAAA